MKKAIRILIPILLTVAILFCTAWYLFVYDRDFTRDMLLSGARFFESKGNHTIATWLYDCAYEQAEHSDAVALELAEQYRSSGNYSRAEYTLTNAISDGGGLELYTALCKLYVEQDKLLDAVNFLNKVADPDMKAALDAMRPADPITDQTPGFYNQYFSVNLSAADGKLYASTTESYPSVKADLYKGPIPLVAGENTIYAMTVGDNGLVSNIAIFGYTIGGVIEEVKFSDPAMEAEIRGLLEVASNKVLFTNMLWGIKEFTVPEGAASYQDLRYLPYLEKLTITGGIADQLESISALSKLTTLHITSTNISTYELSLMGALPNLKELTLQNCGITSISGLAAAKGLTYLDLSNNSIRNIDVLSSMQGLQTLYLEHNSLVELDALSALSQLSTLDVSYNSIRDFSPVCVLKELTYLDLGTNSISVIPQLTLLGKLTHLDLSYNSISDISQVYNSTQLSYLNVSNNVLTDISGLSALTKLTELDFSYNKIVNLPKFAAGCALVTIKGAYNQIESLDALKGLKYLNAVYMDYNEKISSLKPLMDCPVLIRVYVFGTSANTEDAEKLKENGVIVDYSPV